MNRVKRITMMILSAGLVLLAAGAEAEETVENRITAYLRLGGTESQVVLEVWMENATPLRGLTLPFKFAGGKNSIAFDSMKTDGGRAEAFTAIQPVFKAENQTLLINLLQGVSKEKLAPPIPVGKGPLAWIYLSSKGKFPVEEFKMASVRIEPQNVLLFVTDTYNSVTPQFEFTRNDPPAEAKSEEKPSAKGATP